MAENSQDLPLKLAQARQELRQAQARVAELEASLAIDFMPTESPTPSMDRPLQKLMGDRSDPIALTKARLSFAEQQAQRQSAEAAAKRYTQRLEILHNIDIGIINATSTETVVEAALSHIRQIIPCQRASVILFDWTTEEWLIFADDANQPSTLRRAVRNPIPSGWDEGFGAAQTRIIDDLRLIQTPMPVYTQLIKDGLVSGIQVRLLVQGQPLGLLGLNADTPGFFTEEHQEIASEVANQLAIALQQMRLSEKIKSHTAEVERQMAEIQRTNEALRRSETLFRGTFEQAAVGIAHLAFDGHWLRFNQRFCDIVGYTAEELVSITFQALTYPADLTDDLHATHQLLQGEIQFYTMRKRYFHQRGHLVWVNLTVSLVRDGQGLPDYFVAVVEDITQLKQTEQALLKSEERYRRVSDDQVDLIGRFQPDFKLTFVNRAYSEAFGKCPDELIGQSILSLIPLEHHKDIIAHVSSMSLSKPVITTENPVLMADGSVHWIQWTNRLIVDEAGNAVEYQGVGRDITDQKKLQAEQERQTQAVEEMRQFLESTLDAFSASTAVLASDGTIIKINAAWQQFCKQNGAPSSHHYLAENYLTICDNATGSKSAEAGPTAAGIRAVIKGEQDDFYLEYPCHSPAENRWFGLRVTPFAEAPPRRVVTAHINITERKQTEAAEREQRRFAEALHNSLAALTASLDVKSVMQLILEYAATVVPYDAGSIILFEGNYGRVAYLRGFAPEAMVALTDYRFPIESLTYGNMLVDKAPYFVADTQAAPEWIAVPLTDWIRSSIGIPIELRGQIIGVLVVDSATPYHFQPTDIEKLQAFARYASLALENAYHVTELEQRVSARTAELQAAKERVEAILNNSLDGILLVDPDLRIQQTNLAFNTLVGYAPNVDLYGSLRDLIHLDDWPQVNDIIQTIVRERGGKQVEMRCYRKNGTLFDAELSIGYIKADDLVLTLRDITERKARERQLLFHASLQETVADAVIATDLEFRIQSWNRAAETIYGWCAAEVMGRSIREVLQTQLLSDRSLEQARHDFLEKGSWTDEVIHRHKTGRAIHILSSTVLFKDEPGVPFGMVSVNHDITERKKAEQAIQAKIEEERTFQNYLKELHEITVELTQIDQLDDFYQQIIVSGRNRLGFDRLALFLYDVQHDTALGTFGTDLEGKLSDERFVRFTPGPNDIMRRAFRAAERFCVDGPTPLYHNLEPVGFGWNAAAALWSGTQSVGWLVADNLIHQQPIAKPLLEIFALYALTIGSLLGRKQIQAALRESETRYRLLADNITDMVIRYNAAGEFAYVSPSSRTLLGYEPEALLGQSGFALVHPDDLAALQKLYAKVLEHPTPTVGATCRFRHREGYYLWMEFAARIIQSAATGELLEIIASARDVTQRKRAEDALRTKAEEEHAFQTYLKALHEITIELTLIDTLDDFYQRAVELGLERLGFERLGLLLYDAEQGIMLGTYGTDPQGQVVAEHHLRFASTSLTGILQRTLTGTDHFTFDEDAQLFSDFKPIGFGWNAASGLWDGQQSLGCLAIDNGVHHKPVSKPILDILALYSLTIGTLLARKQADAALRESEEKFRLLLEAAPIATVISDQRGQIMLVNDQAERLFGYQRNELVHQPVGLLVPDYARDRHTANQKTYVAAPRVRRMGSGLDLLARRKDGSEFPVEIELSYIETQAGLLVMSFVIDITERKQSAAALEEQRTFLRQVIDVSPNMIFVKDYDARFVLVNPVVAQMYNTTVDALLGKSDADFNPNAQEVAAFLAADRRVIDSEEPLFIEEPLTSPSGETYWLQTTKVPIISADGQSKYVLGVAADITARKKAEEALRQNEELLRTVLENLPVGIWIIDPDGMIRQSNLASQQIWGGAQSISIEAYNEYTRWWDEPEKLYATDDWAGARAITKAALRAITAGETTLNDELEIEAFDGAHKFILNSAIPIRDPGQKIQGVIVVNQDITERKQNEKRIHQAFEREKELSELKSRFVSMASHEFRTPLASILALTETLRAYRQRLTEDQIEQRLGKIQEQVGHLKDIMEDVLQLARLQARRTEFNPAWFNLDSLCQSILDEFQSWPDVSHQFLYTSNDALRQVKLDKKLIRQIINNLVSNAIKYSPADTTIRVNLAYTDEVFVLTVCDQGIGIPAADLPHLFEPFHRAVNVGTIAGTGLGLVITKESVELHGGTITLESQVGVGTTFTVRIPIGTSGAKKRDENLGD